MRLIGVAPRITQSATLPKQVPALIEPIVDLGDAAMLVLCHSRSRRLRVELVLFFDQRGDAAENFSVIHAACPFKGSTALHPLDNRRRFPGIPKARRYGAYSVNSAARISSVGHRTSSNLRGWRRPTLVGVTGVVAIALAAGWHVRPVDPPAWQSSLVVGLITAAAVWIRSGRRNESVEHFGPWALLVVLAVAVQATGDLASPYQPLYLLIVLYAAAFLPPRRFAVMLLAVVALTAAAVVRAGVPYAWGQGAVIALSLGSAAIFVHGLVRRLDNAAQTDGLTGLWNHAAFWRRLQAEDARARRSSTPYSVLMIDVDHFKALNDKYGHQAGDAVLRRMADILGNRVRGSDVLARYGGEEFAVLLPDTSQSPAADVAEKLRRLLAVAGINVSIGVADNADENALPDEVVAAADAALYDAKLSGRARVRTAPAAAVIDLPEHPRDHAFRRTGTT